LRPCFRIFSAFWCNSRSLLSKSCSRRSRSAAREAVSSGKYCGVLLTESWSANGSSNGLTSRDAEEEKGSFVEPEGRCMQRDSRENKSTYLSPCSREERQLGVRTKKMPEHRRCGFIMVTTAPRLGKRKKKAALIHHSHLLLRNVRIRTAHQKEQWIFRINSSRSLFTFFPIAPSLSPSPPPLRSPPRRSLAHRVCTPSFHPHTPH
jgi:hypothetical protein